MQLVMDWTSSSEKAFARWMGGGAKLLASSIVLIFRCLSVHSLAIHFNELNFDTHEFYCVIRNLFSKYFFKVCFLDF